MYTPIVASLGYILSPDRTKTLLVHRNKREQDQHLGKYNGLGGKMLANEDIHQCLVREIYEEAGISCEKGEVEASVFDRYRVLQYTQAGYKPYIIAAMILLSKFKLPAEKLSELLKQGQSRIHLVSNI